MYLIPRKEKAVIDGKCEKSSTIRKTRENISRIVTDGKGKKSPVSSAGKRATRMINSAGKHATDK